MPIRLFDPSDRPRLSAGLGFIENQRNFRIFGVRENLPTSVGQDLSLLVAGTIPLPPSAGTEMQIVSTDPADTAIILLELLGPGGEYLDPFPVALNGTTPVPIPGGPFSRINNAQSIDAGGFSGSVYIESLGGATRYAAMAAADQRLNQALYTIPKDHRADISVIIGSMIKASGTETVVVLDLRLKGLDDQRYQRPFRFGLQRGGSSSVTFQNLDPANPPSGPTDVKFTATASSADASVQGTILGTVFDYRQQGV